MKYFLLIYHYENDISMYILLECIAGIKQKKGKKMTPEDIKLQKNKENNFLLLCLSFNRRQFAFLIISDRSAFW